MNWVNHYNFRSILEKDRLNVNFCNNILKKSKVFVFYADNSITKGQGKQKWQNRLT